MGLTGRGAIFNRLDTIRTCDRQTDGRTLVDEVLHLRIARRSNNLSPTQMHAHING